MAASATQKKQIRDVVLTHAHLDHIAGLPLFIDDLFSVWTRRFAFTPRRKSSKHWSATFLTGKSTRVFRTRNANGTAVMKYQRLPSARSFQLNICA
jgi:glyoxylase-like metal-dependent hydrolase (beta-lactamase superfamily II)